MNHLKHYTRKKKRLPGGHLQYTDRQSRCSDMITLKKFVLVIIILVLAASMTGCPQQEVYKPVIYLYPTNETEVSVKLDYVGELTCTYPEYNEEWKVRAYPDGTLINLADNKEYSYLFWEGIDNSDYDFSKGFVVKGSDTKEFLQDKLSYMGLTPKEYNEFIVFWLPKMMNNKYNLITFQGDEYTDSARLTITPEPDSVLRVFMAYKPLKKPITINEQILSTFERKGFTVVEWGGTCVD